MCNLFPGSFSRATVLDAVVPPVHQEVLWIPAASKNNWTSPPRRAETFPSPHLSLFMFKMVPLITQQGLLTLFSSLVLPVFAMIIYGDFWSLVKPGSRNYRTDQLAQSSLPSSPPNPFGKKQSCVVAW